LARPFGDAAVLVDAADLQVAQRVARRLEHERASGALAGVEDVVLGFGTVTVTFDPRRALRAAVLDAVSMSALDAGSQWHDPPRAGHEGTVEIAVRFDGPDLDEVAGQVGWSAEHVVERLVAEPLSVAFVGFSPGFAYLHGLPPELAGVPRKDRPRPVVPAGSLAIAGGFAAVYPQATPGGWHLVGRTGAVLFDPERPPYAVLGPGTRVRLVPTHGDPRPPARRPRPALRALDGPSFLVERAGSGTVVEDAGRRGVAVLGVPGAGAMDTLSLGLANRLVGNDGTAAALEVTAFGPRLRAMAPLHVAVLGAPWRRAVRVLLDGHPAPEGEVLSMAVGSVLEVADERGGRALVTVSGGIDVPSVLGSRSYDTLCGLGAGPLRQGDVLAVGVPGRPRGWLRCPSDDDDGAVLRVLPGPECPVSGDGGLDALRALLGGTWTVSPDSNRVGIRLRPQDPGVVVPDLGEVPSRGMVRGAVQCPPGGELVVLGPDHATVGGYPVPAVVIAADLHRLAHLVPGKTVRLAPVDAVEAQRALARLDAMSADAVGGWFPTLAG
jgi:KipI family sensor histidine kinase inhibitor